MHDLMYSTIFLKKWNTDLINLLWLLFLRFTRDACVNLCLVWCPAEQRPICLVRLIITMTSNPVFENNLLFRRIINYFLSEKFKGKSSCRESEIQNLTTLYPNFLISRTFWSIQNLHKNHLLTLTRPIGLPTHALCAENCGSAITHR